MKELLLLLVVVVVCLCGRGLCEEDCDRDDDGFCKAKESQCGDDPDEPCFIEEEDEEKPSDKYSSKKNYPKWEHLSMLEGVKVGHVQEHMIDGFPFKLKTLSMRPLLFEIPDGITN